MSKHNTDSPHEQRMGMDRRILNISLVISFALIASGCAVFSPRTAPQTITKADARLVIPWGGQYRFRQQRLTEEQSKKVNDRLGRQAVQSAGETINYYAVTRHPKRMTGDSGLVFVEMIDGPQGPLRLVLSLRHQVVQNLVVEDGSAATMIRHEFLDQFIGRDLEHSFKVETDPAAFHRIPVPIAPLAGHVELSQRIADAVLKVVVLVSVLKLE
ncbi:MAG: hypothetical protein AB1451_07005 [Nitrospirota bacterium]